MQMKPQRNKMLDGRFHSLRNVRKGTQMSNRRRANSSEEGFSVRNQVSLAWSHFQPFRDKGRHSTMDSLSQGYRTGCMHLFLRLIWLCVNRNVFNIGIFSLSKNRVIYWLYWLRSCLYWQGCNLSHWSHLRGSSKVLMEAKIFAGLPEALLYLPTMSLIKDISK